MESRGGAARRPSHRGGVPSGGRGRAGRRPAADGQCVQGPARAQCHRPHPARSARTGRGGIAMTSDAQLPLRSPRPIGTALDRIDGPLKVTGAARYAYEYPVKGVTYVVPVQSTIARGRIVSLDASAARAVSGVLAVLWHENAPRLAPPRDDQDLAVLQSDAVAYRGQFVAAVVAETLEAARQAARTVAVQYEEQPHDVVLSVDRGDLFTPEYVPQKPFGFYPADTVKGDVEAALAAVLFRSTTPTKPLPSTITPWNRTPPLPSWSTTAPAGALPATTRSKGWPGDG